MNEKEFTPALGYSAFTPLYDLSVGLLTRESKWRSSVLRYLDLQPSDRVLDVGCGTGSLVTKIKESNNCIEVHGIDPDGDVLEIAKKKAEKRHLELVFHKGFLSAQSPNSFGVFSKVVTTLVLHQTPVDEKRNILESIRKLLKKDGFLYIADYGLQRNTIMKTLFRCTVQMLDGVRDTRPNAEGCIPLLMSKAGFVDVQELEVIPTLTGSISIYSGKNA